MCVETVNLIKKTSKGEKYKNSVGENKICVKKSKLL